MAFARVQAPAAATATGGASVGLAWTANTTLNNLLVAIVVQRCADFNVPTIVPPAAWVLAFKSASANSGSVAISVFYISNAAVRSGVETFTSNVTGDMNLHLLEYSGFSASTDFLDVKQVVERLSASTTEDTGLTAVTSQDAEVILGLLANVQNDQNIAVINFTGTATGGTAALINKVTSANATQAQRITSYAVEYISTVHGTTGFGLTLGTARENAGIVVSFGKTAVKALTNLQVTAVQVVGDGPGHGHHHY